MRVYQGMQLLGVSANLANLTPADQKRVSFPSPKERGRNEILRGKDMLRVSQ